MPDLQGTLNFLARDERYLREKPFALRYNPVEGIATENIVRETILDVPLHDIRDLTEPPSFDGNGVAVCELSSQMAYDDWFEDEKVKEVFFPELRKLLEDFFGTPHIQIFEYKVRRRTRTFPVSTGNTLDWAQPVSTAHVDFNLTEIKKMVQYHNGSKAEEFLKHRYQCINVWRPLRGPVRDWPLALCDAKTVNAAKDLVTADVVYQDHVEENLQVHYSSDQRWLYLSDQQPSEMLIFRCADSLQEQVLPGVPHCSFPYPTHVLDEEPRESIEVRALILRSDSVPATV